MIPITPIGTETFSIFNPSSVTQPSSTRPTGSFSAAICSIAIAIPSIRPSSKRSLSLREGARLFTSASAISNAFALSKVGVLVLNASAISFRILFFSAPLSVESTLLDAFASCKNASILYIPHSVIIDILTNQS